MSTTLGWIVDLAIGFILAEAVVLLVLHRRTGRGLAPRDCLPNLAAGLCLMLSARAALAPEPGWPVAAWLLAAGAAHAGDLAQRWGRRASAG